MWTRTDLKTKAKERLSSNYWKMVLIGLIMSIFLGGHFTPWSSAVSSKINIHNDWYSTPRDFINGFSDGFSISDDFFDIDNDIIDYYDDFENDINDNMVSFAAKFMMIMILIAVFVFVVMLIAIIIMIIYIPLDIFILNPLYTGCQKFFLKNLNDNAKVKEICFSFDNGYMNTVKIMFFKDLFTFLWSLLLVVPGIIKSYEYRMIPYILSENPYIEKEDAFQLSKDIMDGHKFEAFMLDLSFIGWEILSLFTIGLLGIFYVNPYRYQTNAALYETLKALRNINNPYLTDTITEQPRI